MDELTIIQLEKKKLLALASTPEGLSLNDTRQLEIYIKLELLLTNKPTEITQAQLPILSSIELTNLLDGFNIAPKELIPTKTEE